MSARLDWKAGVDTSVFLFVEIIVIEKLRAQSNSAVNRKISKRHDIAKNTKLGGYLKKRNFIKKKIYQIWYFDRKTF